jgi:hypothetical protein
MGAVEGVSVPRPSSPPKDPAVRRKCFDPHSDWRVPLHAHFFILFFSFWNPWFEVVLVWAQGREILNNEGAMAPYNPPQLVYTWVW